MAISKQLNRFAQARGMSIQAAPSDDALHVLGVSLIAGEEADFYIQQRGGEFFLFRNAYLEEDIWEELPYWMPSEADLKAVLVYVSNEFYYGMSA